MPRKPKEPTSLQRARKAHADRLREKGFKAATIWKSPEGQAAMDQLSAADPEASASDIVNAALIEAAKAIPSENELKARDQRRMTGFMATLTPEQKEAALAYRGDDKRPAPEKAEGRRDTSKPAKTPAKPAKPVSEAPAQTVKASELDVPFGPQKFTPRLKGLQKGKAK